MMHFRPIYSGYNSLGYKKCTILQLLWVFSLFLQVRESTYYETEVVKL